MTSWHYIHSLSLFLHIFQAVYYFDHFYRKFTSTEETVDWDIDDEDIAELDLDTPEGIKGTVTVVDKPENNGKTTTITLQAKDAANQNVSTPVTVKVNVKDITSITPNSLSLFLHIFQAVYYFDHF